MKKTMKFFALVLSLVMICGAFAGCGNEEKIVVTSKNFNESIILGHMLASLIENNTDINVERKMNLGGTKVALEALNSGGADMYVDYTGTGYVNIMKQSGETDPDKIYDLVSDYYQTEFKITWLEPLGFNNTYAMAIRKDTAEKYNLKTCSDLAEVSGELILGSTFEFAERPDGYLGLQEVYGMNFKDIKSVDGGLRYQALANGNSDVIDAFSTEGLLKAFELVVLEDDKNFFPPYYAVPIVRTETLEKYPQLKDLINKLGGMIDEDTMIELNYKVDKLEEDPRDVAENFLKEKGLIE